MADSASLTAGSTTSSEDSSVDTRAVTRTYEHLHFPTYLAACGFFAAGRTIAYHPMSIALARKQGLQGYGDLSTSAILRRVVQHEGGARAITTGLTAMMLANSLSEVIYSGLFEYLRFVLPFDSEVSRDAAAGYAGDMCCRGVYTPLLLVSNRQMTQAAPLLPGSQDARRVVPREENTIRGVVRSVLASEGPRGFFRGLLPTITVGCSWTAVWWPLYGQSKRVLYEHVAPALPEPTSAVGQWLPAGMLDREDNTALNGVASAFTSGTTAAIFNPFLVVRTRLQIATSRVSLLTVTKQVYREAGVRGFWQGTCLSISACVFDGVMAATCYEWAKLAADTTK